jgi:hypothetical protein
MWMNLEDIMLSEISSTEENKRHITSLRCGGKRENSQKYIQPGWELQ